MRFRRIAVVAGTALMLGVTGGIVTSPASPAEAHLIVQTCTIKSNDAHGSKHKTGTINAVGSVVCTVTMDNIFVQVHLQKPSTGQTWSSPGKQILNTTWVSENASTGCANGPGIFQLKTQYFLTFPAGYSPRTASGNHYGNRAWAECGIGPVSVPVEEQVDQAAQDTFDEIVITAVPTR
jgi:hypothetical protein